MKRKSVFLMLLIAAATLMACKKGGGNNPVIEPAVTPVGANDGTAITKTIGNAGGTIVSDDGEIELIIPSGALAANTDISIQPITNNAPNGRGKAYRCTPDGQQFAKDITIKFHYTEEEAAMTKPGYMQAAFQNADGTWKVIDKITNDVAGKTLNASVNHFTDFTEFDIMRLVPPSLYLKTGATGAFEISFAGMSTDGRITSALAILQNPVVWKANGVKEGNSEYGTLQEVNKIKANYTAPATAPSINPIAISAEVNIPFTVDGQRFNQGILTGHAHIVGAKYNVLVETTFDIGLGTLEKFRLVDHVSFDVILTGPGLGTVTNIQNNVATIHKIENSPFTCNTEITSVGTGNINLRDGDISVLYIPFDKEVTVSFGAGGEIVSPKATTTCTGVTPGNIEMTIGALLGGPLTFDDNGQQQVINISPGGYSIKYTIIPLP